ncbi:MAG: hypothetical protein HWN68_14425 [Desulfobacterales bacterium]|nr:hypothetical protein [Desulfobacterales bacterium]
MEKNGIKKAHSHRHRRMRYMDCGRITQNL